ncbi:MAG: 2-amino-4-hydroxy-6-hydroxymethyldihydropteridine diphosphokinase [Prolixibacteraceae bacterium]|nr:2-amino-4-hydroxy-6-hydroxymethyldihydropteridine diphosphokinase [Prolixibacteraceae bacterium]
MTKLYLLLGGNLGDKKSVFAEARMILEKVVGKITAQSALYETEPWGFDSEDLFWNQVLEITTVLSPDEVLQQTQNAETGLGRIRKAYQYASRIIDIDILFYGELIINQANLIVPHPRIQERKFTLIPLCEIAPDLIHPVFQKNIRQLLDECTDPLKVVKVPDLPEAHS